MVRLAFRDFVDEIYREKYSHKYKEICVCGPERPEDWELLFETKQKYLPSISSIYKLIKVHANNGQVSLNQWFLFTVGHIGSLTVFGWDLF